MAKLEFPRPEGQICQQRPRFALSYFRREFLSWVGIRGSVGEIGPCTLMLEKSIKCDYNYQFFDNKFSRHGSGE
jgi:hypothetical protein